MLDTLGRLGGGLNPTPAPAAPEPPPAWLRDSLLSVVKLPAAQVDAMDHQTAARLWSGYISGEGN